MFRLSTKEILGMFEKCKHSTRSLSHSGMGVIRGTPMSIRIGAKKNYKKFYFFLKKGENSASWDYSCRRCNFAESRCDELPELRSSKTSISLPVISLTGTSMVEIGCLRYSIESILSKPRTSMSRGTRTPKRFKETATPWAMPSEKVTT